LLLFRFSRKKFSLAFALSHIIFILIMAAIYFPGEKDAQHQLFWILPSIFDLPISLIYPLVAFGNMIMLAAAFATLGTIQYAIIGWVIDLIMSKNRKELLPTKLGVIPLGIFLCLTGLLAYKNYAYTKLPDFDKSQIELENAKTELDRFYALNDAAKKSFESKEYKMAEQYAAELLSLAQKYSNDWNYGNAIYDSHTVLGRIALLRNDVNTAEEQLFLSATTPGSPQLNSFGPNMSLAKDLLEKGNKESVIKFLNQCKKFWYDNDKVDDWIKEIQEGRIPDFGANLIY
jgi:hypothetical protein